MPPELSSLPARVLAWTGTRRFRRRAAWLLVGVLAVRAALPLVIERVAESVGTAQLGRRVEIADVDLALWVGGLTVEGVAVGPLGPPGGEPPEFAPEEAQLAVRRLVVDLGWLALASGEVRLEELAIDGPRWLSLRDAEGHLVPLLRPVVAVEEPEPADEEAGPGLALRIDRIDVTDLDASFVNLARPEVRPIQLTLAELTVAGLRQQGGEVTLDRIGLREPKLRVLRDVDVTPFLGAGGGEPAEIAEAEAPAEPVAAAPLKLRLDAFEIETATFTVVTDEAELAVRLSASADGLTLEPGVGFPVRIRLGIEDGEVGLEGKTQLRPPAFEGLLRWRDLPLASLARAAGDLLPVGVASGASSGELTLSVRSDPSAGAHVAAKGRLDVRNLAAEEREGAWSAGWKALEVGIAGLEVGPGAAAPPRVDLSNVSLESPKGRFVRAASEAEAAPAAIATPPGAPETPSPEKPAPAPEISIAQLAVRDGAFDFVDTSVEPNNRSRIVDLEVEGAGLRWPARRAERLVASFRGPDRASFSLEGSASGDEGRAHLELADLELPPFSPYAVEASGYWLEEGLLGLKADLELGATTTRLDSDMSVQHLELDEVEPGSFERQFGVPIGLGIALLQDPSGRIGLPIRASFGGSGTDVSATAILVAALRQAILGALMTPLKTAGLLLGKGKGPRGLTLEPIAMAPGASEPADDQAAALAGYAKVLERRPGLGLELHGSTAPEDRPHLAELVLRDQVVADAELPSVDAGFFQRRRLIGALEARAGGEAGELDAEDAAALERWIASVDVPPQRFAALANERAAAVRRLLIDEHGVDPERVAIGDPTEGAAGVVVGLAPAER